MTGIKRPLQLVAGILSATLLLLLLIGFASGWRSFVVTTPSMGTALPVGTLAITKPANISELAVGDVVTAEVGEDFTRTHRVITLNENSIYTKGDLNGSRDPLALKQENIVGKIAFSSPVLGWILRMIPIIIVVWAVVYLLSRRIDDPINRHRYRMLAVFCGFALSIVIVRPLYGTALLSMRVENAHDGEAVHAVAHTVNTGLMPIKVDGVGKDGTSTGPMSPTGTDGYSKAYEVNKDGKFVFQPRPALSWPWWIGMLLLVISPFAWYYPHYRRILKKEAELEESELAQEGAV
ncbi:S26 family signal peptidase [Corynebacterium caspium]|uniref:S26 family signal peptidase n=1 Tax=Corynebacterium caspium TaxID=234828 RepID=UPI0003775766|nr:S26 family signal peptidase [Corynebacterium caspium]WKD58848.1 hypothetical protein CCASP_02200 [Corynebacterium caspium DSM 44850]